MSESKYEPDFPLEKILTVRPHEYCESAETELSNYRMVGMHVGAAKTEKALYDEFREYVPLGTEVVVNYKPHVSYGGSSKFKYVTGVALIPKDQNKDTFENK